MAEIDGYWRRPLRRTLTRRRLAAAGPGVALALLAACGSRGRGKAVQGAATDGFNNQVSSGNPVSGGTLAISQLTNPPTLDSQRITSFYTLLQASMAYSRLLKFKTGLDPHVAQNRDVEGDLAASYESVDAITWTVKLRPEARFQRVPPVNGHGVEAEDVRTTFERALAPENPFRSSLDMIEPAQIQSPDKSTVVFKLKYPFAPFQSTMGSSNYSWIYPREVAQGGYDPAKVMIGSGPFLLDSYTPDVAATYKRNPDWYGKPQPYVDGARYAIMPDITQQRAQFTGGNLDLLGLTGSTGLNSGDLESLRRDNPQARVNRSDPGGGQLIFVQLGDPASPFQDVRLRRAFSMAIDRQAIAQAVYNGDAVPQWFVPLALGKWAMRQEQVPPETAQYYRYDQAGARALLQASGMQEQQFKLIYATGYLGPAYEQAAQTTANMLQQSGFKVTLAAVDYTKDFIAGGKGIRYGNYDKNSLVFAGITQLADADDYITNYYHSKGTSGLSRLNDPSLDAQIAKARTVVNPDERLKVYLDIQRYLADKMYTISGFHLQYAYQMTQPRVQNYQQAVPYGLGTESWAKVWLKT